MAQSGVDRQYQYQLINSYTWPQHFRKRREFNRCNENESYVTYLRTKPSLDQNADSSCSDESDDEDDEDDEGDEDDENYEDESPGDEEKTNMDESDSPNQERNEEEELESPSSIDIMELFMRGTIDEEKHLAYGQVEKVVMFCENDDRQHPLVEPARDQERLIAMLDDRASIHAKDIPVGPKCGKPYPGLLTEYQLEKELSRKRFREPLDKGVVPEASEQTINADRRILFMSNLDARGMRILAAKASRSQAPALKDFFYKYLEQTPSIGVTFPPIGFPTFTLDFHITYYVLQTNEQVRTDTRKWPDGRSLRQSHCCTCFTSDQGAPVYLYEAQTSIVITGIDNTTWVAVGTEDTYFKIEDSLEEYRTVRTRGPKGWWDPLAGHSTLEMNAPIWTAKEYFLKAVELRVKGALKEWQRNVGEVRKAVEQRRTSQAFTHGRQEARLVKEFSKWNADMMRVSRLLSSRLSENIDEWDAFQAGPIGYLLPDDDCFSGPYSVNLTLDSIRTDISKLKRLLASLNNIGEELGKDNKHAVGTYFSFENHDANTFQVHRGVSGHIIEIIGLLCLPFLLTSSLFSTQGVLPFTPNIVYFGYFLIVYAALVVVAWLAIYFWESWAPPVVHWLATCWRVCIDLSALQKRQRKVQDDVDCHVDYRTPHPQVVGRAFRFLGTASRRAGSEEDDIEMGVRPWRQTL